MLTLYYKFSSIRSKSKIKIL